MEVELFQELLNKVEYAETVQALKEGIASFESGRRNSQGGKAFLQPLAAENLPAIDEIKGDRLAELRRIFDRLFDCESVIC